MKIISKIIFVFFFVVSFMFLYSESVSAYIDPSVMTYAIQIIAGIAIAVGAFLGVYFRKIKKKVGNKLGIDENKNKEVESDEIKIKQVLINLISNSIKFTNRGTISLTIEKEKDDYFKFTVTDTGIGIPLDKQPELFNAFSKAKLNNGNINKYGAGLGLTITNEISKLLGKQIQFESVPNKGSSFWFSVQDSSNSSEDYFNDSSTTIKMSEIALNASPVLLSHTTSNNKCEDSNSPITVLIADDEILIRNSMKRILIDYATKNSININIIEANDGIEILYHVYKTSIRKARRSFDSKKKAVRANRIDFIISDENMLFYTGKQTAKKLVKLEKALNIKHIPFYLSSAYSFQCIKANGIIVDGVFHKPLIASDLEVIFTNINSNEDELS